MKLLLRGGSVYSLCLGKGEGKEKNLFSHFPNLIFDEFSPFHPNEAISSFGSVFDDSGHGFRAMKKKTTEMRASPDDLNW